MRVNLLYLDTVSEVLGALMKETNNQPNTTEEEVKVGEY